MKRLPAHSTFLRTLSVRDFTVHGNTSGRCSLPNEPIVAVSEDPRQLKENSAMDDLEHLRRFRDSVPVPDRKTRDAARRRVFELTGQTGRTGAALFAALGRQRRGLLPLTAALAVLLAAG